MHKDEFHRELSKCRSFIGFTICIAIANFVSSVAPGSSSLLEQTLQWTTGTQSARSAPVAEIGPSPRFEIARDRVVTPVQDDLGAAISEYDKSRGGVCPSSREVNGAATRSDFWTWMETTDIEQWNLYEQQLLGVGPFDPQPGRLNAESASDAEPLNAHPCKEHLARR
ncbi:hypothetical protein JJD41_09650 [Oxynema sp. CENA135]|uniref:hypothetical protein n=1 Tax=Oxynema sp. CENA135 TaxID=984206 RepID=UPI00190A0D3F|nr:hypothetical protein [Oxynema sp. CENA135]MBK4730119.1 hypothetical protein [Oxynema sp. CENA135]